MRLTTIIRQISTFAPDEPKEKLPHRDELVQLLIADINTSFLDSDCYFLNTDLYLKIPLLEAESIEEHCVRTKQGLYQALDSIIDGIPPDQTRLQIILRIGAHYLTLDIDKEKHSCFVIDAAGNILQEQFLDVVNFSRHVQYVAYIPAITIPHPEDPSIKVKLTLQQSAYGCFLFALDHACHVASISDIHSKILKKVDGGSSMVQKVKWLEMPPEMVKNSQSTKVISAYKASNLQNSPCIDELTNNNKKNHGFETTRVHYMDIAYQLCDNNSEEEIAAMVSLALSERRKVHRFQEFKTHYQGAKNGTATITPATEDEAAHVDMIRYDAK